MIGFVQVRSFLLKLFTTILLLGVLHLLVFELVTNSRELFSTESESRFKRSVEGSKEEVLLDLPGHQLDKQFIRKKRLNTTSRLFEATDEWQSIEPDHIVPPGLHYRINMATGKKEAKLLDGKANRSKELLVVKDDKEDLTEQHRLVVKTVVKSKEDLAEEHRNNQNLAHQLNMRIAIHGPLPDKGPHVNEQNREQLNGKINKLQNEFEKFKFDEKGAELTKEKQLKDWRTIDEIKKEFEDLNIKLTSDSENVHSLLDRYRTAVGDEEKITILKDLEYILHQYDVSGDFIKMDGLNVLHDDFLNNRNREIQSLIALVLGSSSSSNPPVKIAIIKSGLFDSLIAKLSSQDDLRLNLRTFYAVSAIVRQFPFAQKQFIEQDGLKILKRFFEPDRNSSNAVVNGLVVSNSTDLVKIQTKIISLLSDLKEEHEFTADELHALRKPNSTARSKELSNVEEKMKQYNAVDLEKNFIAEGYCLILPKNLNNSTLDVREKVLKSMYSFRSACKGDFKRLYLPDLLRIREELRRTAEKERETNDSETNDSDDDYYQNLTQLTQNLIDYLNL